MLMCDRWDCQGNGVSLGELSVYMEVVILAQVFTCVVTGKKSWMDLFSNLRFEKCERGMEFVIARRELLSVVGSCEQV